MSNRKTKKGKWGRNLIISKAVALLHAGNSYNEPCRPLLSTLISFYFFAKTADNFVLEQSEWGAARDTREHWAALHSAGIAMNSQGRLASSCCWNSYTVLWFLSRFRWITEEQEGDWTGGWNWRCKERPAKFWSICCAIIEPLVLTWLNAALSLDSHRLLYCAVTIISWHTWKRIFCFLIVHSTVSAHENPREEI